MGKTTFIATGDSFMTRRLPENGYEGFDELVEIIKAHDVRFNNLEITIHNKEGYPSAFSGGTWAMAEPAILDDLKKYGFNLYNTANNHSLDYSHGGLLATIKYLNEKNMLYAGTGENLATATEPVYLQTPNARVAMIGACSSFHDSDAAGNQGLKVAGRPGLNPLRFKTTYNVTEEHYKVLEEIADATLMNAAKKRSIANGYAQPLPEGNLFFGGLSFKLADEDKKCTEPNKKDMDRIAAAITEAKRQADYVVVSLHAHETDGENSNEPAEFIKIFSKKCIDAGADAILGHGPHELRGIEIYNGKPIFYSLGNFIFQTETVSLQPADAYENANMPATTEVGEYMNKRSKNGTVGYIVQENIWRSVMAAFTAEDGKITEVQLYPITLNVDLSRGRLGSPTLLKGSDTLQYLASLSEPFGTKIEIDGDVGKIRIE